MTLPEPHTAAGRSAIAALVAEPARALLALDFDGTLAPVVERAEDARPAPGALAALGGLARLGATVVIVTGRSAATAVRLAGLAGAPHLGRLVVLGHYGLERWDAATATVSAPAVHPGVVAARDRLPGLLRDAPAGVGVEDKQHSVAVHARRAADPRQALADLDRPLRSLAAELRLEAAPGRHVLELRPPGVDKGVALRSVLDAGVRPGALLVAGDDIGDGPAFVVAAAARAEGVPTLVVFADSAEGPEQLRAAADLVVDGPGGVVALLAAILTAAGAGAVTGGGP